MRLCADIFGNDERADPGAMGKKAPGRLTGDEEEGKKTRRRRSAKKTEEQGSLDESPDKDTEA